ncbi:acetylserotonin O-methyltransferase [Nonomuraea sp. NBC_00507]|uniref:methyltransferase n=1 Tax=Nonomuraea sp. NBC_00507 TaxID=2976002 RepID=UPI002E178E18
MRPDPTVQMMQYITGAWVSQAISVAATLGVADELARGPHQVEELAQAVGADADALYRLLRALTDLGLFQELDDQRFALTEVGELLRTDRPGSLAGMAKLIGAPFHRRAWTDLVESVRTGESAFERLFGFGFDHFRDHPDDGRILNEGMTAVSGALVAPSVLAYDFSPFQTIVDVGGGHGALLAAVLSEHPKSRGVLFDLPHVIQGAGEPLAMARVKDRCELVGGDFFESVPSGGDAYLLSNIIHDWGDDDAVRILANCRAAMKDTGRVLLCESVIPDAPREPSPTTLIDLEMLVMARGARQRTASEYTLLFERAGLHLTGVHGDRGTFSIVEGRPLPE